MKIPKGKRLVALLTTVLMFITAFASPCVAASARVRVVDLPPPSPTSISCSVFPTSVMLGNSTTVSGSISPAVSDVTVTLTYTKPDATTIDRTTTTGADGSFSDTYIPDMAGSWSVKASWAGNDNYFGSTSFNATFTVSEPSATGIPMDYVYVAVIIIIVIIVAIVAYWYRKKR
jgi:hypothetical protein